MTRYIMEEMPDLRKAGKRITHPKFARIDNASIKEWTQREEAHRVYIKKKIVEKGQ